MNDQHAFERIVAESVESVGPLVPSDAALEQTMSRVGRKRQRPEWLALIKEPPMRTHEQLAVGSPVARVAVLAVASVALGALVVGAGIAGAQVLGSDGQDGQIVVDQNGGGDAVTITEAVDMASGGDEIVVMPGTYTEAVRVDKDIKLRGGGNSRDDVVIVFPSDSPALTLTDGDEEYPDDPLVEFSVPVGVWMAAPDAELSGISLRGPMPGIGIAVTDGMTQLSDLAITIDGVGAEETGDPAVDTRLAVHVAGAAGAALRDSTLDAGVDITEDASATVEDSILVAGGIWNDASGELAVRRNTLTDAGIWSSGPSSIIEDNALTGGFIGLSGEGHGTVSGNTLDALRYDFGPGIAITLWDGVAAEIVDNTITNSATGIKTQFYFGSTTIENNVLTGNTVGVSVGAYDTVVADNTITDSKAIGVEVFGAGPTLTGNLIASNAAGLHLGTPKDLTISGNKICDNDVNVRLVTGDMPDLSDNEICQDPPAE